MDCPLQLLVRLPGARVSRAQAIGWAQELPLSRPPTQELQVLHACDSALTYLRLAIAQAPASDVVAHCLASAQALAPLAETALLQQTLSIAGASAGQPAGWHYVVETDIAPQAQDDLNAWYTQEHLPGLAAVAGTVRAARHDILHGAPRHHACYDLHTRAAFNSPAWLAVRGTAWSDRVRPHFHNTRRTMFQIVD